MAKGQGKVNTTSIISNALTSTNSMNQQVRGMITL